MKMRMVGKKRDLKMVYEEEFFRSPWRYLPYPTISNNPWPERLNTMTFSSLFLFASRALSMAALMAWEDSGAGMIPSVLAKVIAASKVWFCS